VEANPVEQFLYGEHELTIDEKNRLLVPADIRKAIDPARDGEALFLLVGLNRKPWFYTEKYYQSLVAKRQQDLTPDEDLLLFDQMNFSMISRVEPDKQGRLVLPEKLLRRTGIGKEVTMIGARDHLELWNRVEWEARFEENLTKLNEIAKKAKQVPPAQQ
jgi:MraZ protein